MSEVSLYGLFTTVTRDRVSLLGSLGGFDSCDGADGTDGADGNDQRGFGQ